MGLSSLVDDVADFLDPGDIFGREASDVAGQIQQRLMEEALRLRQELFGEMRQTQEPVRAARDEALSMIQGLRTGEFQLPQDPTVPFQQEEVQRAIKNQAAARGKFGSGGRFMTEQDAAAQIASQDINRNINRLLNMAGFSTGDLSSSNALLTGAAGGLGATQMGVNQAGINASLMRQNANNQMFNTGFGLAGYYAPSLFQNNRVNSDLDAQVFNSNSGLF